MLSCQLKVVVVVLSDQPHLVFVATKQIEVGDELLIDYNDRQSTAEFLKHCPVCSRKRPVDDVAEDNQTNTASQLHQQTSTTDEQVEPGTSTVADEEPTAEGSGTVGRPRKSQKLSMVKYYYVNRFSKL